MRKNEEYILFRIISGYYYHNNYELDKIYELTIYDNDYFIVNDNYNKFNLKKIRAEYIGLSIIDKLPTFRINKKLIRINKIISLK